MFEYIIMFIISAICCSLSYKYSKNKIMKTVFMLGAILVPSIIAGNRSLDIGTDIKVYGHYMHYVASNFSVKHFFSVFGYSDILFSMIILIVGKLFKNIHICLFFIQFLNCAIIYKACDNYKEKIPVWLSYLLFLLTLYFRQLNLLRQGLAISITVLATTYLLKNENKKFILYTMIASLIHISSIIFILAYFIKNICEKKLENKAIFVVMYIILGILFLFFIPILKLITSSGILPAKYTFVYFARYINQNNELDNLGTFFKLFWVMLTLMISFNKYWKGKINNFNFFFHLVLIDFILWNLNIYIHYFDRLSFYFGYAYVLFYIPQLYKFFKNDMGNRIFVYVITIVLFIFYWYVRFVYQNAGNVFPYIHY